MVLARRRRTSQRERTEELAAYLARMRRLRAWYGVALAVILGLVASGVKLAYRDGELSHTIVRTARTSVAAPALTPVQASLTEAWTTDQASATGQPVQGGIVVTHTANTVYGRSVLTGAVRWSYARTDGVICAVAQVSDKTLVLFRRHSDCDELNAVDTATGARAWQRSLTTDSTFVTGVASMKADTDAVDIVTATSITKVSVSADPCDSGQGQNCGLDYWFYTPDTGCQVSGFVPGSLGDLISERCSAGGDKLLLHDRYTGTGSLTIRWKVPVSPTLVPASADTVIGAIQFGAGAGAGDPAQLVTFNSGTGAATSRAQIGSPAGAVSTSVAAIGGRQVSCVGVQCYSVAANGAVTAWPTRTLTPPVLSPDQQLYAVASSGLISVSSAGAVLRSWPAPAAETAGEQAVRVAGGFVLFGAHTTVLTSTP